MKSKSSHRGTCQLCGALHKLPGGTHTIHKIKSHHTSLAAAVEEAKPDLSYNEPEAHRHIRSIDRHCTRAFVMEDGSIYYVYSADIELLHKFDPFIACLSDSPFLVAFVVGDTLSIGTHSVPKTAQGREWFKTASKKFDALAA